MRHIRYLSPGKFQDYHHVSLDPDRLQDCTYKMNMVKLGKIGRLT